MKRPTIPLAGAKANAEIPGLRISNLNVKIISQGESKWGSVMKYSDNPPQGSGLPLSHAGINSKSTRSNLIGLVQKYKNITEYQRISSALPIPRLCV